MFSVLIFSKKIQVQVCHASKELQEWRWFHLHIYIWIPKQVSSSSKAASFLKPCCATQKSKCHWQATLILVKVFTCMRTLRRSRGAVQVRDTAPAPPPATRWRHHIPVFFSSAVNSSGTIKLSPTSNICREKWAEKSAGEQNLDNMQDVYCVNAVCCYGNQLAQIRTQVC